MSSAADQNQGDVHHAEACAAAVAQASQLLHQAVRLSKEMRETFNWTDIQARLLAWQIVFLPATSDLALIRNPKQVAEDLAAKLDRTGGQFDQLDRHLRSADQAIGSGLESLERVGELPERCVNAAKIIDDDLRKTWTGLRDVQRGLDRTREHVEAARKTLRRVSDLPETGWRLASPAMIAKNDLSEGHGIFSHLTDELRDMDVSTEDANALTKTVARNVRADAEAANRGSGRPWVAIRAAFTRRPPGQAPPRSARMRGEDDTAQNRERGGRVR